MCTLLSYLYHFHKYFKHFINIYVFRLGKNKSTLYYLFDETFVGWIPFVDTSYERVSFDIAGTMNYYFRKGKTSKDVVFSLHLLRNTSCRFFI